MYSPCLMTNIISVVVAAFALRFVMTSQAVSPLLFIIVAVLFIVGQFLYLTHRFRPVAGMISFAVIILSILLLRVALGTSPFVLDSRIILGALIVLQIIKLPIG